MSNLLEYFNHEQTFKLPYVIAEAGVNHEGSMDLAKRLIDEAAEGGAQAIKFQTYKANTIASKDSPSYWDLSKEPTESQFALFKKYDSFWKNEFENLKKHCDETEIEFLSTPFDKESAEFLNDLMPVFKISSSDLSNHPFIEFLCGFGKPIILSTGASYTWEIQEVVEVIGRFGNPLCLMHCVLNYPTPDEFAKLGIINELKSKFPETAIGYSDHTLPKDMETLKVASLLGATIIEKHFTHDKTLPGNDHYHAMDKEDLKVFFNSMQKVSNLIGSGGNTVPENELISRRNARRSLVTAKELKKGEILTEESITWKRPGVGISPKYLKDVLGKEILQDMAEDEILYWDQVKSK